MSNKRQEKISKLIDAISSMDYGNSITHSEIGRIIDEKYGTRGYNDIVSDVRKKLPNLGKMIENSRGVGYQVVNPDDYVNIAVKKVIAGGKRITEGGNILRNTPVKNMSKDGYKRYCDVSDRMRVLEASIAGATVEVKMLERKNNPLLLSNIQKG